jgi:hypothetical protein
MANRAVFCLARNVDQAETIVQSLKVSGFSNNDISVLMPDVSGTRDFAHEHHTKAPEAAAAGGAAVGVLGAALGWLAGIGSIAIPGLGPFIAAGPIMAALSGAGLGAAVGGLAGALVGMGIPEYEAKRYDGRIRQGSILVSVHCDSSDWVSRAKDILKNTGAEDVASAGEASSDYGKTDKPLARRSVSETPPDANFLPPRTRPGGGTAS